MSISTKHRIINNFKDILFLDAAGDASVDKTDIDKVIIPGTGTLVKANYSASSYLKNAAVSGTNGAYTLTFSGAASSVGRNAVTVKFEVVTDRHEAEYSRYAMEFGRDFTFSTNVPASATATAVATAIQEEIDARVASSAETPFTVTRAGAVITVTMNKPTLQIRRVAVLNRDSNTTDDTIFGALANTVPAVTPIGQGSQIEESISHLTNKDAAAWSMRSDERIVIGDEYDEYRMAFTFSDALSPMPQAFGVTIGQSGVWYLALFVNKKAESAAIALLEGIFDGTAGTWNE